MMKIKMDVITEKREIQTIVVEKIILSFKTKSMNQSRFIKKCKKLSKKYSSKIENITNMEYKFPGIDLSNISNLSINDMNCIITRMYKK